MNLKFRKKGSMLDGIYIVVICLILFIVFAFAKIIWDNMTEDEVLSGGGSQAQSVVNRYNTINLPMFDKFFVFVIFGAYFAVFILAYYIRGTPAFLPIMIFIIIIGTVLSTFVSNVHDKMVTTSPVIATAVSGWGMTEFLMENLPWISFFMMVALTIIMLALGETV